MHCTRSATLNEHRIGGNEIQTPARRATEYDGKPLLSTNSNIGTAEDAHSQNSLYSHYSQSIKCHLIGAKASPSHHAVFSTCFQDDLLVSRIFLMMLCLHFKRNSGDSKFTNGVSPLESNFFLSQIKFSSRFTSANLTVSM